MVLFVTVKEELITSAGNFIFIAMYDMIVIFGRKHQCVSNARGARSEQVPDLNVNNNARPDGEISVPSDAEAYFSLDDNVSLLMRHNSKLRFFFVVGGFGWG